MVDWSLSWNTRTTDCPTEGHALRSGSKRKLRSNFQTSGYISDNYQGACLIFEKHQLDSDVKETAAAYGLNVHAEHVNYRNPNPLPNFSKLNELSIFVDELNHVGIDQYVANHVAKYWRELYFVKIRDWDQEREFRWLISGDGGEDFYVDIKHSLVGILMGDRFPDDRKSVVGSYALDNNLGVALMDWKNGFPQPAPTSARLLIDELAVNHCNVLE